MLTALTAGGAGQPGYGAAVRAGRGGGRAVPLAHVGREVVGDPTVLPLYLPPVQRQPGHEP